MSYLTQSEEELWRAAIEALEGEGFQFNPLTTDIAQYLETCLGQSNALETKSIAHMLADINASFGGSLLHLTSSVAHLLDDIAVNISAGGGGTPEEDDDMALISSGTITSPVTFFDIVLPAGYAKFRLDLIDFRFSGLNSQPILAYILSPDGGANWYNNTDDLDSYSFSGLSEDVSTAVPSEGFDSVGNLAANGASKDIYFNGELTIWPGSASTKAMVRSELNFNSGDPFTWNSMASRLETIGRQNKIRFSFGDASLVPPNGNNEWTDGSYTLYGYA